MKVTNEELDKYKSTLMYLLKKYNDDRIEWADLKQLGFLALIKSIEVAKAKKLSIKTVLPLQLQSTLQDYRRNSQSLIRIPAYVQEQLLAAKSLVDNLLELTNEEKELLKTKLNLSEKAISRLIMSNRIVVRDYPVNQSEEPWQGIEKTTPENVLLKKEKYKRLWRTMNKLSIVEKKTLIYRYGLNGQAKLTYQSISDLLKMSKAGIQQAEKRAIRKIREKWEA